MSLILVFIAGVCECVWGKGCPLTVDRQLIRAYYFYKSLHKFHVLCSVCQILHHCSELRMAAALQGLIVDLWMLHSVKSWTLAVLCSMFDCLPFSLLYGSSVPFCGL